LLTEVQKHRAAVDRHSQHTAELAVLSSQIDKQELRKFYFSVISVLVLLAIIVPLIFQTPPKREWLPAETETILSLNVEQMERDELPKRWRKDQAADWQNIWAGLTGSAQRTPVLNLPRDAVRVTRAMTSGEAGAPREVTLIEARNDVARVIRSIEKDKAFERRPIGGLPVWLRPDFAVAQVGPRTLAVGSEPEVEQLARVRLGIKPDLKTNGQLFDRFQALNQGNAIRLVSRDPSKLNGLFHPFFPRELLDATELLGLSLNLQNPVKARLFLKMKSAQEATEMAARIRNEPQRWLKLPDSDLVLSAQAPDVETQGADIQVRFDVPENAARLLLQRLARANAAPTIVGN
jgi:hypothetical protein